MKIETDEYAVAYDRETATVACRGSLRLSGMVEYAPIVDMLNAAIEARPPVLTLDLRELEFLNSSGINAISKFAIRARNQGDVGVTVLGSRRVPWQAKSLPNLKRLMPKLVLELA